MGYVNVHVDLDCFGDDEILEAAVQIVRQAVKDGGKTGSSCCDAEIDTLRALLFSPDEHDDEPLSTAAKMREVSDLRKYVEEGCGGMFRFARTAQ